MIYTADNIYNCRRLDVVKSLVPKGTRLLDIGTDHASLPIELVKNGICNKAIASDVNEKPLQRAKNEILKNNLSDKITTILSNGFENIEESTYDVTAICGMGGHLISEIIQKGGSKAKNCYLILQPMSYPEALRQYLYENGYEIITEKFAFENNKPYVIIFSKYTGKNTHYEYGDLLFGKFRNQDAVYKLFERKLVLRLKKRLLGILKHKIEFDKN